MPGGENGAGPLAISIDDQDGGFLERRGEKREGGVGQMVVDEIEGNLLAALE